MTQKLIQSYNQALNTFIDQIKQDKNIVAAILFGSLVEDDVWEKSDIDITLIGKDEQTQYKNYWLMGDQIDRSIQVTVFSRNRFKREIERVLHGSPIFHVISTSRILFSHDETISEYFQDALQLGTRDVELQLLQITPMVIGDLEKAEKFLYFKEDLAQSYLFITRLLDRLAQIVVLLNNEIPGREVIEQAMKYESELFQMIFVDVILEKIDEKRLTVILDTIRQYIIKHTSRIFKPILDFLSEADEVRSNSDLVYRLNRMMPSGWWEIAVDAYGNWLTEQGFVYKVPCPIRLTKASRTEMDENGYYYLGGDSQ